MDNERDPRYMEGFEQGELYVLQYILRSPGNASFAAQEYMKQRELTLHTVINAKVLQPARR